MTRTAWAAVLALALSWAGLGTSAEAGNWSLALDASSQVAEPGETAIFTGVVTNTTGAALPIDVSLDLLTTPETEGFGVEFAEEFLALGLDLPVEGYSGPLFRVTWDADTPYGTYGTGEILLSAFDPADPGALPVPFTVRTPGVGVFCTESTGITATSVAVAANDSTDAPGLAYNTSEGLLRYARPVADSWVSETVQSGIGAGANPAIVFDGQTRPHVVYYNAVSGDLRHATKPMFAWALAAVDTTGNVGASPALVIESSGELHVSYFDVTNADLKYAHKTSAGWAVEVVDSGGSVGSESAVAVDESGRPYIAYYDATNEDLKLAYQDADVWLTETVPAAGSVGTSPSIQVRGGLVSIACRDATAGTPALLFAEGAPGSWSVTTVDAAGDPGLSVSLQVNGFGQPRIAYRDAASGQVKYAARADGVTWEIGMVSAAATGDVALALSRTEEPFVSYLSSGSVVRFASFESCATAGVSEETPGSTAHLVLQHVRPNPFSPGTAIAFTVPRRSLTTVRVYDAAGRLVAEPFHAVANPGLTRVAWNGEASGGRKLPSGVYVFEVRSGRERAHGRMVLLR